MMQNKDRIQKGEHRFKNAEGILGTAETRVDVYFERQDYGHMLTSCEFMVELSENFKERYNLVMAC